MAWDNTCGIQKNICWTLFIQGLSDFLNVAKWVVEVIFLFLSFTIECLPEKLPVMRTVTLRHP
jgi:hypothetical protein